MDSIFICDEYNIRPKPRKEKRWIGVRPSDWLTTDALESLEAAKQEVGTVLFETGVWHFVEIEVEV